MGSLLSAFLSVCLAGWAGWLGWAGWVWPGLGWVGLGWVGLGWALCLSASRSPCFCRGAFLFVCRHTGRQGQRERGQERDRESCLCVYRRTRTHHGRTFGEERQRERDREPAQPSPTQAKPSWLGWLGLAWLAVLRFAGLGWAGLGWAGLGSLSLSLPLCSSFHMSLSLCSCQAKPGQARLGQARPDRGRERHTSKAIGNQRGIEENQICKDIGNFRIQRLHKYSKTR